MTHLSTAWRNRWREMRWVGFLVTAFIVAATTLSAATIDEAKMQAMTNEKVALPASPIDQETPVLAVPTTAAQTAEATMPVEQQITTANDARIATNEEGKAKLRPTANQARGGPIGGEQLRC